MKSAVSWGTAFTAFDVGVVCKLFMCIYIRIGYSNGHLDSACCREMGRDLTENRELGEAIISSAVFLCTWAQKKISAKQLPSKATNSPVLEPMYALLTIRMLMYNIRTAQSAALVINEVKSRPSFCCWHGAVKGTALFSLLSIDSFAYLVRKLMHWDHTVL